MDFLLNAAKTILEGSVWITNHKELLGVVIGGSGVVSLTLEPVKRWLSLQRHMTITILHYLFALIAVGIHYIATSSSQNPAVLAVQALVVLGTNQFIYPSFTKPLAGLLVDAKAQANVTETISDVNQLTADFRG